MADIFTVRKRSALMAGVRSRGTAPELLVRRALREKGYRYRTQVTSLPGRPDIVLPEHRIAVFVHGCFWHHHPGCARAALPKTNAVFWSNKIAANVRRDLRTRRALAAMKWRVLVIWGCEAACQDTLARRLRRIA